MHYLMAVAHFAKDVGYCGYAQEFYEWVVFGRDVVRQGQENLNEAKITFQNPVPFTRYRPFSTLSCKDADKTTWWGAWRHRSRLKYTTKLA